MVVLAVEVKAIKLNNFKNYSSSKKLDKAEVSFSAAPKYVVKKNSFLKKVLPTAAFIGSLMGSIGYLIGGSGLYYDVYLNHKNKKATSQQKPSVWDKIASKSSKKSVKRKEEGVKTVVPETKFSKIGMKLTKIGIAASSVAGASCGIVEGIPTMTIGELTNISSSSIIETPIGTGLFGIGIASIFSGLALDNTPELKLNQYKLMAEKGVWNKSKMIGKSVAVISREIGKSIFEIVTKTFKKGGLKFLKESFLEITPKTVVFQEKINKDGKVVVEKMLRHNKNYLMHAASFTLGLGGLGIILSTIFKQKKPQKAGLKVEEGGFLFDNLGITKYGIDKITNNGKAAGFSFATGGVINAVSQFMGIDNKDGRALQWLGISGVFLGYAIDRGKTLRKSLANLKARPELTDVLREWKIDLSKVFTDKKELKTVLKEIKKEGLGKGELKNKKFISIENALKKSVENASKDESGKEIYVFKTTDEIKANFNKNFPEDLKNVINEIREYNIADKNPEKGFANTKNVLDFCTEKIFGTKTPKLFEG